MNKKGNALSIDMVKSSDFKQLINFLTNFDKDNRYENKKFWEKSLNHWWVKNPIFSNDTIRGVKLVNGVEIVGFLGVIPLPIIVNQQEYLSYGFTTWRVNQRFRTQSIRLLQLLLKKLDNNVLFNNSATSNAYFIFTRMKFVPFYKEKNNCYYFFLRPPLFNRFNSKLLLKILELGFSMINFYQNSIFQKHSYKYDIRILNNEYDCLDDLWMKSKNNFNLKLKRNTKVIEWLKNYNGDKMLILGCYENNKLNTCFIFMTYNNKMVLMDMWGEISIGIIKAMIFNASKIASENIAHIEIPEYNSQNQKLYKNLWLIRRYNKDKRLIKIPRCFKQISSSDMFLTQLEGDKIHC